MPLALILENENELLKSEYNFLIMERQRRSNEQKEYLKYVLISIAGQFGILILNFFNSNQPFFKNLDKLTLNISLLVISCIIVIITTILFFLWLDHALTISAIDNFFKEKEKENGIFGWYKFRESYSKKTYFNIFNVKMNLMGFKIFIFSISIIISFLIPPLLFVVITLFMNISIKEYENIIIYTDAFIFILFTFLLLTGFRVWKIWEKVCIFLKKINKLFVYSCKF